jgi:hypothetical protein
VVERLGTDRRWGALPGQPHSAAAQVEHIEDAARDRGTKESSIEGINDELALLVVTHQQFSVPEHPQVVRHVDYIRVQTGGQFANILGSRLETLNDPQSLRVRNGLQETGTILRSQSVIH